ncbi:hypothetical protein AAFC00_000664 [Neodothiora populina]|uniref:Myb-like DNA-binding domain-containing protein n=1 Tax=Neodothiora populina TaxID=2781224 RepID=A0ABR3PDM7_9PEZI
MPAKIDADSNLRFLYSCFKHSNHTTINYAKVAQDFQIKAPAARMRLMRLKIALENTMAAFFAANNAAQVAAAQAAQVAQAQAALAAQVGVGPSAVHLGGPITASPDFGGGNTGDHAGGNGKGQSAKDETFQKPTTSTKKLRKRKGSKQKQHSPKTSSTQMGKTPKKGTTTSTITKSQGHGKKNPSGKPIQKHRTVGLDQYDYESSSSSSSESGSGTDTEDEDHKSFVKREDGKADAEGEDEPLARGRKRRRLLTTADTTAAAAHAIKEEPESSAPAARSSPSSNAVIKREVKTEKAMDIDDAEAMINTLRTNETENGNDNNDIAMVSAYTVGEDEEGGNERIKREYRQDSVHRDQNLEEPQIANNAFANRFALDLGLVPDMRNFQMRHSSEAIALGVTEQETTRDADDREERNSRDILQRNRPSIAQIPMANWFPGGDPAVADAGDTNNGNGNTGINTEAPPLKDYIIGVPEAGYETDPSSTATTTAAFDGVRIGYSEMMEPPAIDVSDTLRIGYGGE